MSSKNLIAGILFLTISLSFAADYANVYEAVTTESDLGTIPKAAIDLTNLTTMLSSDSLNSTFFAPSSNALLQAMTLLGFDINSLAAAAGPMKPVLMYHLLTYSQTTSQFPSTVNGKATYPTYLTSSNPVFSLNVTNEGADEFQVSSLGTDANIIKADIVAGESTVHIIDTVLLPFYLNFYQALTRGNKYPTFVTYASALAPKLIASFANPKLEYTLFVSTEEGFNANFAQVQPFLTATGMPHFINAHIVPKPVILASAIASGNRSVTTLAGINITLARKADDTITVTSSTGVTANVKAVYPVGFAPSGASLGQVYVVDKPLIPTAAPSKPLAVRSDLTTLTTAITTEGTYTSVFNGSTAFAGSLLVPTDAAFTAFLAAYNATASQLLADKEAVKKLIAIHVVNGTALNITALTNNTKISTAAGANTLTTIVAGLNVGFRATNTSSANVIGSKEYFVANSSATIVAIDAVLIPSGWTMPPKSGGNAASIAAPSSLGMLFSGLLAFALLHFFGQQH